MVGTDLAERTASNGAVALPATAAVVSIADWAAELDAAYAMAKQLCVTAFAPKHFQGKPADAAAAILTGHELGLTPMASLRSIFMIGGTPGMYAKVMVAVAQSRGHKVWVAEQSNDRVVVKGQRRGESEVYETVWDRARVVQAKLTGNAKYQESPQQMMVARGQAEIARQVAADALHGIPYSVEELEDMPPIQATAKVDRVAASARLLEDTPSQPATVDSGEEPVIDIGDAPLAMTPDQSTDLHGLLRELGSNTKAKAPPIISGIIGRDVADSKELTVDEAATVILELERRVAAGQVAAEAEQPELVP